VSGERQSAEQQPEIAAAVPRRFEASGRALLVGAQPAVTLKHAYDGGAMNASADDDAFVQLGRGPSSVMEKPRDDHRDDEDET
jgi:hypothetical protein